MVSVDLTFSPPTHLFICSLRGPGGRGPWPNPNTNSVSLAIPSNALHLYIIKGNALFLINQSGGSNQKKHVQKTKL